MAARYSTDSIAKCSCGLVMSGSQLHHHESSIITDSNSTASIYRYASRMFSCDLPARCYVRGRNDQI